MIAFGADGVHMLAADGVTALPSICVESVVFALYDWPVGTMELERAPGNRRERMRTYAGFPARLLEGTAPGSPQRELWR